MGSMKSVRQMGRAVWAAALLALAAVPQVWAQTGPTTAMDGRWHFTVAPYFWFAGLDGSVSVKGITEVPVKVSFSDIWNNFDFGLLGRVEGRKNRWGFAADLIYLNLGATVATNRPILGQLGLEADLRQLVGEGLGTYRAVAGENGAWLDVIAGVRYVRTSTRLSGQALGVDLGGTRQSFGWADVVGGARFRVPLGSRLGLTGRTDFSGLASAFTWNAQGALNVSLGQRWTVGAGYRYFDLNYEKGDAAQPQLYKVAYSGPNAFVAYSW